MSELANQPSDALSLVAIDENSPAATLQSAKKVCLEAFGHWGSVPCPGVPSSASLLAVYAAVHRVHGVCGFAALKKHHQPGLGHLPQNNGILHTVCVEKHLRGLGIGTSLVRLVVERARLYHELDYLLLAAQKGPNQPRLLSLYARCGFLEVKGEEVSSMGSSLARKISDDSVAKLASFLSSRSKDSANVVAGPGNVWMKMRLRSRCVEAKRGVEIADSDFPLPKPPPPFPLALIRTKKFIINFEPQVGPSCGLTCLYMIRGALGLVDGADDLLSMAQERGLTKDGEMFSTRNFAQLCSDVLPTCEVSFHATFPSSEAFASSVSDSVFLVPFDIVGNSVGFREGNASHWGIVSSFLKPLSDNNESSPLFLYVQHSQNRVPILTEYRQLLESNSQLKETNAKFSGGNMLSGTAIEIKIRRP